MAELKIYLSNSLNERFRQIAMSVHGYGRGSLSKAAEEALTKWCSEHESVRYIGERLTNQRRPTNAPRQKLSPTSTRTNANPPTRKCGASEKMTPRMQPAQPRSPRTTSLSKCEFASRHFRFALTYRSGLFTSVSTRLRLC